MHAKIVENLSSRIFWRLNFCKILADSQLIWFFSSWFSAAAENSADMVDFQWLGVYLNVVMRIPVWVVDNDGVSCSEVDTETTSTRWQQETERRRPDRCIIQFTQPLRYSRQNCHKLPWTNHVNIDTAGYNICK